MLATFVGGQIEVQNEGERYIYRGEIKTAVVEANEVRITLNWMAKGEGYPPIPTSWVVENRLDYTASLEIYTVSDIGSGSEGGRRLCLNSLIIGELVVLYPSDGSKLDPTKVKGLSLPFKLVGFPCRETGCAGIITDDRRFSVPIQTSCTGSSLAARCPVCGRLHWSESGEPVQSRAFEKVFFVNGDIENRPLESSGRLTATCELLDGAEKKELIQSYYHGHLTHLADLGHAPDCPATTCTGACLCGVTEAKKWLAKHPLETETV
jgi:hypothetical protein